MKKIITILVLLGMFSLQGCTTATEPNYVDNDTISEVIEVTTSFNSTNNYSKLVSLVPPIFTSDMILVYRLSAIVNGQDVWKLLPETFFYADGTMNFGYNYDFSKNDVNIYMVGNDLPSVTNPFRVNQVIRIVIVPGKLVNAIDKNNYLQVINALNINKDHVQKINL